MRRRRKMKKHKGSDESQKPRPAEVDFQKIEELDIDPEMVKDQTLATREQERKEYNEDGIEYPDINIEYL